MRKILLGAIATLMGLGIFLSPGTAHAWWRGGFGGGFIFIGPPVVYAPPPVYYAPPPVVYAAPLPGRACYAGAYVCPLDRPTPVGAGCSCPTNSGRAYGDAR